MLEYFDIVARLWPLIAFTVFMIGWHIRTDGRISNLREKVAKLEQEIKDKSITDKENQVLLQKIEIRMARLEEKITALSEKI